MSQDFFEFSKEQYRQEMKDNAAHYQKGTLLLILLPLLCTAIWKLGKTELLSLAFARVDVFLYYLSAFIAVATIIISWVFLFQLVYPRKYKTLENIDAWQQWRGKYENYLKDLEKIENNEKSEGESLESAWIKNLTEKFVEAQPVNAKINEKRRKAFGRSVMAAAIAVASIGFQAFFYIILKIQGVIQ